jgi:hypothetical protein
MSENPVRAAQKRLYEAMAPHGTEAGIRAARKAGKEAWDKATPAQREEALTDKRPLKRR